MEVEPLSIEGVIKLTPRVFEDARGYFTETYTQNKFEPHLPGVAFVQDNESFSRERYTVRGLHFQAPPFAQDKLVRVVAGAVLDVAVDIRKGSPTYGQSVTAELSATNKAQLFVPKGFLHGFMTLEPDTVVAYKVTAFYNAGADGAVFWASSGLAINWPAPIAQAVLSDKDLRAPDFGTFVSPF